MIIYLYKKVTPVELAKLIIADKGSVGAEFWSEDSALDYEKLTEQEITAIRRALDRQVSRVNTFLGIDDIWDKRNLGID